ncbi:hypothetical protein MO867_18565 [Microbulbifer sp. OS29]|uniref:Uncharacterized protein n=1 Tax=Microbulbifer okhotskensis TaxID=2926617 RepID=A0A9X2ER74_9GAMM|nr:hypothetical protein [Microbulbifer okhotskensis]MCO1336339.1 hypothetical protein [Microbulbifer okhotskensis]
MGTYQYGLECYYLTASLLPGCGLAINQADLDLNGMNLARFMCKKCDAGQAFADFSVFAFILSYLVGRLRNKGAGFCAYYKGQYFGQF